MGSHSTTMVSYRSAALTATIQHDGNSEVTRISKERDPGGQWFFTIYTGSAEAAYLAAVPGETLCFSLALWRDEKILATYSMTVGPSIDMFNRELMGHPLHPGDNLSLLISGVPYKLHIVAGLPAGS